MEALSLFVVMVGSVSSVLNAVSDPVPGRLYTLLGRRVGSRHDIVTYYKYTIHREYRAPVFDYHYYVRLLLKYSWIYIYALFNSFKGEIFVRKHVLPFIAQILRHFRAPRLAHVVITICPRHRRDRGRGRDGHTFFFTFFTSTLRGGVQTFSH